jgi:uncharacterized protein (DUF2062 family)
MRLGMNKGIKKPAPRREFGWVERLNRMIRYGLFVPIKRSRHSPHFIAGGVLVGMVWAMTPLIGLQMTAVFVTWLFTRKVFNWDFSLVNGLAWTWTTNVFTALPAFYIFYITGQVMMGRFDDISGYGNFRTAFEFANGTGTGLWDMVSGWFAGVAVGLGLPMAIGCLPWAILSGWLAYRMSLRFVVRYRALREERMKLRAAQLQP